MEVNSQVVNALMSLRGIELQTLSSLAHVTLESLNKWLYSGQDDAIAFEQQLEILNFLGVRGEVPRPDVVHYWHVHEPLFSRAATNYWALSTVLKAFGPAQVAYITRDADPALSFQARAHFGLRFENFMAILSVTAHPLRSLSFNPDKMEDLTWLPEAIGVLLPAQEYEALQPGAMKVAGMTQYLTYSEELTHWERLREQAHSQGIRAEQVAQLLLGNVVPTSSRIEASKNASLQTTSDEAASAAAGANVTSVDVAQTKPPADEVLFSIPVKRAERAA